MLDEAERSIHDAVCVLAATVQETRTVYGGGCSEMIMAKAVDEVAGKKSLTEFFLISFSSKDKRKEAVGY
jgi:chaperonin GroEL (HSP60 family)